MKSNVPMERKSLKVAILSPKYVSKGRHSFAFVHARAKLYRQQGIDVRAFVLSKETEIYEFEGIHVTRQPRMALSDSIEAFHPDVLAIHYPSHHLMGVVNKIDAPKVAWVHGYEILWNFRFRSSKNRLDDIIKRVFVIPRECYKMFTVRKFLERMYRCVFVSQWMLRSAEKHSFRTYKNAVVIPNPVDTKLFDYKKPHRWDRAVSLRSFDNTKYGLDIAIKAFSNLPEATLTIYGKGRFFDRYKRMAERLNANAVLIDETVEHNRVPDVFHQYGFFIAPSRVEAQGLAMCEAMACGLPVIATRVGGIPEFVRDGVDGFLVPSDDPASLRKAVLAFLSDSTQREAMSRNARDRMTQQCAENVVINREIEILTRAVKEEGKK